MVKNPNQKVCVLLMLCFILFGEKAASQATIDPPQYIQLDQLNIADLDFQTGGSRSWFFTVTIRGTPLEKVVLVFQLDVQLPDGNYPNAIDFITDKIEIPASGSKIFTNLDLGPGSAIKFKSPDPSPGWNSQEAKTRIENEALATGKLPAGTYTFNLSLIDSNSTVIARAEPPIVLEIRNISRLDLISPQDNEEMPNAFPLFQWIFDGTRVEISIYERLPQHQSKEEAAQSTPHLVQELTGLRSFQYPSTASRPLEAGKTYVWKVRGFTAGSGGVGTTINSEIWQFTVSAGGAQRFSLTGGGGTGSQQQNIFNQLQNIPGIPSQILNQLLGGNFQLTGVILVNGVPVSPTEILAVLNDLAQNPDKIIEVQIIDRP